MVFMACDKADIQKSIPGDDLKVTPRTTCNDCPVNYCCCTVQNLEDGFPIDFCGVNSPNLSTTACSDTWGNCSISGYVLSMNLGSYPATEVFCAPSNGAFRVQSSTSGHVRINCQYGQVTPYSIDLYFPGTNYVYVGSDCVVSGHCP